MDIMNKKKDNLPSVRTFFSLSSALVGTGLDRLDSVRAGIFDNNFCYAKQQSTIASYNSILINSKYIY